MFVNVSLQGHIVLVLTDTFCRQLVYSLLSMQAGCGRVNKVLVLKRFFSHCGGVERVCQ